MLIKIALILVAEITNAATVIPQQNVTRQEKLSNMSLKTTVKRQEKFELFYIKIYILLWFMILIQSHN